MSHKLIEPLPVEESLEEETRQRKARQTRFPTPIAPSSLNFTREEKMERISYHFRAILETLGLDLTNDSLQKTPDRVAKMFVQELFTGLDENNFPNLTFMQDTYGAEENPTQTIFTTVSFISFCEHHFLPIDGKAFIAYRPQKKLIGLSKIPRLVHFFARRPQVQERLTVQIADCLKTILETDDVAVLLRAKHYCVLARGVEDHASEMSTQAFYGSFANDSEQQTSFLDQVRATSNPLFS